MDWERFVVPAIKIPNLFNAGIKQIRFRPPGGGPNSGVPGKKDRREPVLYSRRSPCIRALISLPSP